ncbi:MAG: LacI family DNA-binding transcriptional regulator [Nitrospiraceae bacterium]|nr:LacI family DNA-binding transcriptional regulator [Nitrospiraceae bacterium]
MTEPSTRWTIYDIARHAGVSAKTVSRVINGKSGVGQETRERILALIKQVGYYPHLGARSLRGRRQGCIGLVLSEPLDVVPLSRELLLWLFQELYLVFGSKGERICFDLNPYSESPNGDYGRSVWDKLFTACVVVGPLLLEDTTVRRIHDTGLPYVSLGRLDSFPECCSAAVDYEEGTYLSTKFLVERGHKRIAMLKALSGFQPGLERRRGYLRALEEAGIEPDERLIRSVTFGARNIANVVHRLLVDDSVTALVDCSGTEDAANLREGARRAGRVPGDDFEVVVWTYSSTSPVLREACAHLWLPVREATAEGIELLSDWFYGKRDEPFQVLYRPVIRDIVGDTEAPRPLPVFEILE